VKALVVAGTALVVAVAATVVLLLGRHPTGGPDAFAGAYPPTTPKPTPSPSATWQPTGTPAGPLPAFPGAGSKINGRISDPAAGVSYARFAPPWKRPGFLSGGHTTGQEINAKIKDYKHFWYVAVYVGPLDPKYDKPGPQRLRAAAELVGQEFVKELYLDGGDRKDLAGAPMTIDGHRAWVTAFRMTHPNSDRVEKGQTEVVVAVDAGRPRPAIVEVTVPSNQPSRLHDINQVVRSIQVL
jgi:hypothetical protein